VLGVALVYSTLFGIGELIFGAWGRAAIFLLIAAACGAVMAWNLNRTRWVGLAESVKAGAEATGD